MSDLPLYDLAVIGGGINGVAVARDAAMRGAKVVLFEKNDLGSATSSASTKLIHGGLRYLEHYEFRLVRESLEERERLWAMAPHIVWPMRFVLPHRPGMRPAWLLRLGLFLYDHLGGRKLLPPTKRLDLRTDPAGKPLKPGFDVGFEYSDCWVEDSRMVVLTARSAADKGVAILPRTEVVSAERRGDRWSVLARDESGERRYEARALVNAAGPWVASVFAGLGVPAPAKVRLVRGSHIVTRRLFDHDRAYIFQNDDRRIVFAIPYETDFTLIGTTDVDHGTELGRVEPSPEEIDYLCRAVSAQLARPIGPDDVVHAFAGVRPLYDDGATAAQEATRDYVLKLDAPGDAAPLLSIFGGKLTTHRRLAEEVCDKLRTVLPTLAAGSRTATEPLPGGDFPVTGRQALVEDCAAAHPGLPISLLQRLVSLYGTETRSILGDARNLDDMDPIAGDLTRREIEHLVRREWARTAEDVLRRRTKLHLRMSAADADAVRHAVIEAVAAL